MAIDTTNNNIVYEFLTEPRFGLSRRVFIVTMLIGCSFGQVFLMIESIGYTVYIIGVALALLYALFLQFNVAYIMSNRVNLLTKHFPNIITLIRIPLSLSLLLFQHNNVAFMIIYSLCGLSDVLDGYVARKMNLQSVLGAKLDSISDFVMYMISIIILCLWNWYDIIPFVPTLILITLIRGVNIGIIYCKFQQLGVVHTIGNKFVGLLVYSIPLLYLFTDSIDFLWIVLSITLLVSLEETGIIFQMRELDLNRKSLFFQ